MKKWSTIVEAFMNEYGKKWRKNEKEFYRDDKKCAIMQSVPKKAVDSGGN